MTRTRLAAVMVAAATIAGCGTPAQDPVPASTATTPAAAPAQDAAATSAPSATVASPGTPSAGTPASSTPAPAPTSSRAAPVASTSPAPAAAPAAAAVPAPPPAPVFREVTVPSGTALSIELRTGLASDTSTVEETVHGVLRRALVVDGVEAVPAGAGVTGSVTAVERSAKVKGRARLALRFTSVTVDGEAVRMSTASIAREAEGSKRKDAAKIGIGAGAGAVIGAIAGGGKGAAIGSAVGGAAGTGVVLATRGEEVDLPSGTTLATTLTQPLTVRVKQPS